jgi:REP element-mobilizing transposase RayT
MRDYRRTIRLKGYDYSRDGGYFITICTSRRVHLFGEIKNQEIKLNRPGEIVEEWWRKLKDKFSGVDLDGYTIMPNHIHGIVILSEKAPNGVGAIHELPLPKSRLQRRRMLLPKIIGYFKMNSAKEINRLPDAHTTSLWQRNYYEHIIRNENELRRIREYIQYNPLKWDLDRDNPQSRNFDMPADLYWKEIYDPAGAIHELPIQHR